MRKLLEKFVGYLINKFDLKFYRIENLQIGGHCGLCGHWIPDEIFPIFWAWGICKKCETSKNPEVKIFKSIISSYLEKSK
jgi:hypothetical protein